MDYRDTEKLTVQSIYAYYEGNLESFCCMLHPEATLLLSGKGQFVEGKSSLQVLARSSNHPGVHYAFENISCRAYRVDRGLCYTVLSSELLANFPNGQVEGTNQNLTVLWKYIREANLEREGVKQQGWYILHLHVAASREMTKSAAHLSRFASNKLREMMEKAKGEGKVALRDVKSEIHYIPRGEILRFETSGHQVEVHLTGGQSFRVSKKIGCLEEELGGEFVRVHRCHLINARHVETAKNYKITLSDSSQIPVPRSSFPEVKKRLTAAIEAEHS